MKACGLPVERCNEGEPIIAPTSNWWESGVTFNAAAFYLERSPENDPVIRALLPMRTLHGPELAEGVVAIHYRARPETDPGSSFVRSFIGLALFTPDLKPLYRFQEPVIYPSPDLDGYDHYGGRRPAHYPPGGRLLYGVLWNHAGPSQHLPGGAVHGPLL